MAEYAISFARSARRQLQALDRALALRVIARIEALAVAPRPAGCVKLEGGTGVTRIASLDVSDVPGRGVRVTG